MVPLAYTCMASYLLGHPCYINVIMAVNYLECTQNGENKILEFVLLITGSISAVCGDGGKTYASICHLLQTSAGVQVEHSGRCDRSECSGGQVSV